MYKALVCKLSNVRNHPNADKLKLASVVGYQVVVGLDAKDGDMGVFFGADGKLSHIHLMRNNLYNTNPETNEKMGGYFGKNGRVRAQKFRGETSDGFWQEISAFQWCGEFKLKEGDSFDEINGNKICEKYYTPATLMAMRRGEKQKGNLAKIYKRFKKASFLRKTYLIFWFIFMVIRNKLQITKKEDFYNFKQHYDTKQLRDNISTIPKGSVLYISEKCHGTSGRTGRLYIKTVYNGVFSFVVRLFKKPRWMYVTGTRRTVMNNSNIRDGYYRNTTFRKSIHDEIVRRGLHKGETLYYEIVGFTDKKSGIMGTYRSNDKKLVKMFGKDMIFSYGCEQYGQTWPGTKGIPREQNVLVYRITMTNEDGVVHELSWQQVKKRCEYLGIDTVPELKSCIFIDKELLINDCLSFADGASTLDNRHIREGVVVRVEHAEMDNAFKWKGFHFCEMEGIRKNSDDYVDLEEIS